VIVRVFAVPVPVTKVRSRSQTIHGIFGNVMSVTEKVIPSNPACEKPRETSTNSMQQNGKVISRSIDVKQKQNPGSGVDRAVVHGIDVQVGRERQVLRAARDADNHPEAERSEDRLELKRHAGDVHRRVVVPRHERRKLRIELDDRANREGAKDAVDIEHLADPARDVERRDALKRPAETV